MTSRDASPGAKVTFEHPYSLFRAGNFEDGGHFSFVPRNSRKQPGKMDLQNGSFLKISSCGGK